MIKFSIFKIPVQVLPWFWVTLVFLGGGLYADSRQDFLELLLFMIAGFISILVHELGHALTAKHFGNRVEIVLEAFGGYAAYSGGPMSRPRSFIITAAGPAIQILLGIAAFLFLRTFPAISPNAIIFVKTLYSISFFWAILNLLPVLPLDGGQLLQAVLGPKRLRITLIISMSVAIIAAILVWSGTGSFLFPIFLGMFAYQSYKALREMSYR